MKYKIIIVSIVLIIIALLSLGCSKDKLIRTTEDPPINPNTSNSSIQKNPDITGKILDISNDVVIRVLVDSKSDTINGQIWVTIKSDTKFAGSNKNALVLDDVEGLFVIGSEISFLSDGIIMESYPMQTSALVVYLD